MAGVPVALIIFDMNLLLNHISNYVYRVLVCFAEHINAHTATITKNRPSNCIPNIKSGQNADFIFPCGCYSCYKEHNCTHNLNAHPRIYESLPTFRAQSSILCFCVCVCVPLCIIHSWHAKGKNEKWIEWRSKAYQLWANEASTASTRAAARERAIAREIE